MAAKRRRARRSRRRSRSSSSRWLVIGGVVLALGWFVFTRFVFDPFEAPQPRFDLLVPRDVDLFVRRERLDLDFAPFPRPALLDGLEVDPTWRDVTSGSWWQSLAWPAEAAALAEDLRTRLGDSPLDPESLLAGEVALVGRNMAHDGRYALLARLSTQGKIAVEGLDLDSVFGEVLPGATRARKDHPDVLDVTYWAVDLPEGGQLFYTRASDTLVLGEDEQLVQDVLDILHRDPERSLGLSRLWNDNLPAARGAADDGFDVSLAVDASHVLAGLEWLPDEERPDRDALADIWPKVVDPALFQELVGRVELRDGRLRVAAHSELDVDLAKRNRGGLVAMPPFDTAARLRERMALLPDDVVLCLTMNAEPRRLLNVVYQGLGSEEQQFLDTAMRDVSKWNQDTKLLDFTSLATHLGRVLGDELTLVMRPRLTPVDPGLQPLPELALIAPLDDPRAWQGVEDFFLRGHRELGFDKDAMFQLDEGVGVRKWAEVPGMPFDEIAWMVLDNQTLVLTTSGDLLANIVEVFSLRRAALAARASTGRLLDDLAADEARANAALWVSAEGLRDVFASYGPWLAELDTVIDFGVRRAQLERQILQRDHYGKARDELGEDQQAALDARLDEQLATEERERREQVVPTRAAEWLAGFDWLRLAREAVVGLRLGERSADLQVELSTCLER